MEPPPPPPPPQKCPRCDSSNTKFCYYNNYSLSQPRYFCKSCRRYWTHGGTLRNVPVGGGCRKAKRQKPSTSSNPPSTSVSSAPHPNMPAMGSYNSNFYGGAILSSFAGAGQFDANMALLRSLRSHNRQFFVNMNPAMPPMGSWTTQSFIRGGDRNLAGLNSFEPNRAGFYPSR